MRDLNLLNQAWPNAVFGLRPRLFFLLIPYIHIFEITAKIVYVAADLRNLNSIYPRILVKHLQQCFTVLSRREGKP